MKAIVKIISYAALGLTIIPSFFVFFGDTTLDTNKMLMLIGTIVWFILAPVWMNKTQG